MRGLFTSKFVSFIVTFYFAVIIISPTTISFVKESNTNFAQYEDEETFGDNNIPMSSSLSNHYSMLVNYSDVLIIRNLNSLTSMTIADYFRPVQQWNDGKWQKFKDRVYYGV